jgi:hypothetical protein
MFSPLAGPAWNACPDDPAVVRGHRLNQGVNDSAPNLLVREQDQSNPASRCKVFLSQVGIADRGRPAADTSRFGKPRNTPRRALRICRKFLRFANLALKSTAGTMSPQEQEYCAELRAQGRAGCDITRSMIGMGERTGGDDPRSPPACRPPLRPPLCQSPGRSCRRCLTGTTPGSI